MPHVSDEFIKHAERLAQGVKEAEAKKAEADTTSAAATTALKKTAEMVAETLIAGRFVPQGTEKTAVVNALLNPEECLHALDKTAKAKMAQSIQGREVEKLGSAEAGSSTPSQVDPTTGRNYRESDQNLLRKLGLNV